MTEVNHSTVIEDHQIISNFFEANPEYQKRIQIKKVKFALNSNQRSELLKIALDKNYKHFAILKTQLETGLRIGEIANLLIPQLNLHEGYIQIQAYQNNRYVEKGWNPKTKSGNRIVPLNDSLIPVLKSIIGKRTEGYVFISNKKSKFMEESLIRIINQIAKKTTSIGINIGSHCLRRTFASFLNKKSVPIAEISKYLGHKSIKITIIYLYEITDLESILFTREILNRMNK
jgi:integrase